MRGLLLSLLAEGYFGLVMCLSSTNLWLYLPLQIISLLTLLTELGFQINHTLLFGPPIWPMIVLVAEPKLFLNLYSQHTLHLG